MNIRKGIILVIISLFICFGMSTVCFADSQDVYYSNLSISNSAEFDLSISSSGVIGDLNEDSAIDARDLALMKKYILDNTTVIPVEDAIYVADLDGDGSITAMDLSLLKQYILGIITKFPKEPHQNEPIVIMPLGDSITDGVMIPGGYRIKLWDTFKQKGIKVDFVGSLTNGPSSLEDKNHEGHSGWRIDQIDTNINNWMNTYKPQIVLLHIGTNDMSQNYDLANAPARLGALIDKICAKLPANGKLYVAQIIPLGMGNLDQRVKDYNSKISGIVQSKVNQGKPVVLVDMYSALKTSDLQDGVHPNRTGYDKMADVWYKAIEKDLLK